MGSEKIKEDTTTTAPAKDAPALVKKIGRTTYIVRVQAGNQKCAGSRLVKSGGLW